MTTNYKLRDIDSEDIEDLLLRVEKSFGIKFAEKELFHVSTFGELCDHITNKMELENSEDCTSQQAFYSRAIASSTGIDKSACTCVLALHVQKRCKPAMPAAACCAHH